MLTNPRRNGSHRRYSADLLELWSDFYRSERRMLSIATSGRAHAWAWGQDDEGRPMVLCTRAGCEAVLEVLGGGSFRLPQTRDIPYSCGGSP